MAEVLEYKCPACGGPLHFDSATQRLVCDYCDSSFEPESLKSKDEAFSDRAAGTYKDEDHAAREWTPGEAANTSVYICNSCGAEIVTDKTTSATSCPYCDNPVVLSPNLAGGLRPDIVIPFKLDKKAAVESLKKHCMNKKLLPKEFTANNHLEEVKGVYVPFWLYDCRANAEMEYEATDSKSWREGDYRITKTDYYAVRRAGSLDFLSLPVDGSTKMDDALMDSIEPFDMSAAEPFSAAYLAGYFAEKYDVDSRASQPRADVRVKNTVEESFRATVEHQTVSVEGSSVYPSYGRARYALLPVWLLNTKYKGKIYLFAMNGQTGKFVGNLPWSRGKYWGTMLGGLAASVLIYAVLSILL